MSEPADLELELRRKDAIRYSADLIFSQPGSDVEVHPMGQHVATVALDEKRLLQEALNPTAYGQALWSMLFADPTLATAFASCRTAAQSQGRKLRLRLVIAPDASELHTVRWETLSDPETNQPLALSEQLLLSRGMGSADWQPISLRAQGSLRALVVIAAPRGLATYGLETIDVSVEQELALSSVGDIPATVLSESGQASLSNLITQLRNGYDILSVVAHGALVEDVPYLFLDDGEGQVARVSGVDLVARLADLPERPRLILLASCHSAGDASRLALAALGPRLATAEIPAVIAMQGPLSLATSTISHTPSLLVSAGFRYFVVYDQSDRRGITTSHTPG